MTNLISIENIKQAATTIASHVVKTPVVDSAALSAIVDAPVVLKLELLQLCGCFKPRGVANKILSMSDEERARGVVTVSGGNHGIAIAEIGERFGLDITVVMPKSAPARSVDRICKAGATLFLAETVAEAFSMAEEESGKGKTYIHSYDDPVIIAGHGTAGLEFIEARPDLTDIVVSIGGGALISGVSTAVKAIKPGIRVWGVETIGADAMTRALAAGKPVDIKVTSISSTLGAPNATDRTLAHVKANVEEVLTIPDAQAMEGVVTFAEQAKLWVEPAAGCLLPAAKQIAQKVGPNSVIGIVVCGGNVSMDDTAAWRDRFGV